MLALVDLAAIGDLADIKAIFKHMRERTHHEAIGGDNFAARELPGSWSDAFPVERRRQFANRSKAQVVGEDFSDQLRLLRNDFKLLVDATITQRNRTADPNPLALGGGNLVAYTFADHLPLKLGEGEQNVQGQPSHA